MPKQQAVLLQPSTSQKRATVFAPMLPVGLVFVVQDPAGAANLAHQIGAIIGATANGLITFLGHFN